MDISRNKYQKTCSSSYQPSSDQRQIMNKLFFLIEDRNMTKKYPNSVFLQNSFRNLNATKAEKATKYKDDVILNLTDVPCKIYLTILQNIQTQLNTIFKADVPVGPITVKLPTTSVTGPPASDFTVETNQIPLPSYMGFNSPTVSVINPLSTWGDIFLSTGENEPTGLKVQQTQELNIVVSTTGYPVCSNVFLTPENIEFGDIHLKGFDQLTLTNNLPANCIVNPNADFSEFFTGRIITENFQLEAPLSVNGSSGNVKVKAKSSFCGYKSDNPFNSDFYKCKTDLNSKCGDVIVLSEATGSVTFTGNGTLIIKGTLTFNAKYDQDSQILTVNNIQLLYSSFSLPNEFATVTVDATVDGVYKLKKAVDLTDLINKALGEIVPGIFNLLNSYLASQTIQIPITVPSPTASYEEEKPGML